MTPTRKRRLIAVLLILAGVGIASTIAFYSLQQNMLYFQSPSDLAMQPIPPGRQFRLGGLVKPGTVARHGDGLATRFCRDRRTEGSHRGIRRHPARPVSRGTGRHRPWIALDDSGLFAASEVLAKHDENYMPPEVADALEEKTATRYVQA